jgi:hypothetical protein
MYELCISALFAHQKPQKIKQMYSSQKHDKIPTNHKLARKDRVDVYCNSRCHKRHTVY